MDFIYILIIFIFGTIIGSFLNVCALRYGTGLSIMKGESMCFHCGKKLHWYELIPVLSFIFLLGRCSRCKSKISLQYILVEISTGIIFVFVVLRQIHLWNVYGHLQNGLLYSVLFCIYYAIIFSILVVIAVYDLKHKIIPDGLAYSFIVLSVFKLILFFWCKSFILSGLDYLDLFSPILLSFPFAFLWFVSKGKWIGFGDAKFAFGIGALVGFVLGLSAIILAFWIGSFISLSIILFGKIFGKEKINFGSQVPFAPFLVLGTFLAFAFQLDVLSLGNLLY